MHEILQKINELSAHVNDAHKKLDVSSRQKEKISIERALQDSHVWEDPDRARSLSKRLASIERTIGPWIQMQEQLNESRELAETGDAALIDELWAHVDNIQKEYDARRTELLFDGEYDEGSALLRLSAGVGGTDAQDFTQMLQRMYLRWAEKSGIAAHTIEQSAGDEAGIKSAVIEMEGPFAYGKLRSEHGAHRLVRLSPFNSDNLRQTSFAQVEVLPSIDEPDEVKIEDKDIKIDVYRSGGHGGQSVNTTDSAVRVTHIPTGIVVAIQNERSQIQNKETALKVLRSKLVQLQQQQHAATIEDLQAGESASWGSQIRNYVLHPYSLVKDTRTKYEESDVQAVLDGKIDGFIEAYLETDI